MGQLVSPSHHKIYCRKRSLRNTVNTRVTVMCTMCFGLAHQTKNGPYLVLLMTDAASSKKRRDIQVVFCASIMKRRMCLHLFLYFLRFMLLVYILSSCVKNFVCFRVCVCVNMYVWMSLVCDSNHTTLVKRTIFAFYITISFVCKTCLGNVYLLERICRGFSMVVNDLSFRYPHQTLTSI